MTNNNARTCEDTIWGLGSWIVDHVDVSTLRELVDCESTFIEETAERVYDMANNDESKELYDLLSNLSSWREHPSTRGAHLSGLRSALRYVGEAAKQYSREPWSRRMKLYKSYVVTPVTSRLEFVQPVVVTSQEVAA